MPKPTVIPMHPYFKSRGYVPGGIVTNSKNESLDMEALPPFLRTLLVADGTVTKSLEAFFWEQIEVENLGQASARLSEATPWLNLAAGESALERRVRLRGIESGRVYAYAQSLIKLDALPEHLRADLQQGRIGIGELLRERGLETYREILDVGECVEPQLREVFGFDPGDLIYRTYRIVIQHQPVIQITEKFPCSLYR